MRSSILQSCKKTTLVTLIDKTGATFVGAFFLNIFLPKSNEKFSINNVLFTFIYYKWRWESRTCSGRVVIRRNHGFGTVFMKFVVLYFAFYELEICESAMQMCRKITLVLYLIGKKKK